MSEAYGVWGPKTIFGVKYDGISRTTYVIGGDGRIERVFEKVKSAGHAQEVVAALEAVG